MKRLLLFFVVFSASVGVQAQYPYPAMPSVEQLANSFYSPAFRSMCEDDLWRRDYDALYRGVYNNIYAQKIETPVAYFYMGACLELGMGTGVDRYKAKAHYEKGARLGDRHCKERLAGISSRGYWEASRENREGFAKRYGKPVPGGSGAGGSSVGSRPNSSGSGKGRTTCKACGGSGQGYDEIVYQPDYTGRQGNVYCSKCGKYASPHSHRKTMCRGCYGKGYIEY